MNKLTHWNPFKSTTSFNPIANFDDLFRGWGLRSMAPDFEVAPEIRIDVSEDNAVYKVKAEMPGVDKKDIEVSIEGNQVAIGAEVKREETKKEGEKSVYTDRYYGKVYRAFTLPSDLDAAKAGAHYEDGVLMLTLPKKGNGGSRRITVN